MRKFAYIDQIRGIAILMVVLVHTAQKIPGLPPIIEMLVKYGQMGVQLFFVASAITLTLSHFSRNSDPKPYTSFLLRRFFRIAPLYYIGIALYFGIHMLSQKSSGELNFGAYNTLNVISNAIFIHGFVPGANNSIVPGGWSIGTEMLFYFLLPPILKLTTNRAEGSSNKERVLLFSLVIGPPVILMLSILLLGTEVKNNSFLYFNIINQLPVFVIGIIYALLSTDNPNLKSMSRKKRALLASILFVTASMAVFLALKFRSNITFVLLPAVAAISFIFLVDLMRIANLRLSLLESIGQASYSIYIFHFAIVWVAIPWLLSSPQIQPPPSIKLAVSFSLGIAITFAIAKISERNIEAKGIGLGAVLIKRLAK